MAAIFNTCSMNARVTSYRGISQRASSSLCALPSCVPRHEATSRRVRSLVVRAKTEPTLKSKVGPGSIVPWADASVQRLFQLGTEPINWDTGAKVLSRQTKDTKGIIAFTRAELEAKGPEALTKEGMNMPTYAMTRSLFIEVWLCLAAMRAGIVDPINRRALGLVYSATNVDSERNAFTVFANVLGPAGADVKAGNGVSGILDALVADVKEVAAGITEDDKAKVKMNSKTGYDSSVTEVTLKAIASAAEAALAALPAELPSLTVVPLMMPALRDPGKEGAKEASAAAAPAAKGAKGGFGGFGAKLAEAKQKLPDFSSMLKKQQRPGFVELNSWVVSEDKVTGSEAVTLVVDFALRAHAKLGKPLVLVVPGAFMASTITMGTRKLAAGVHVVAVGEELPELPQGAVAVVAAFTPAPNDGPLDGPSGVKTVEALKKAGLPIVVVAVTKVASPEMAADIKEKSSTVEKVNGWAQPAFAAK